MTTMKGILKGLRYISQIFDSEKEEEMEIGFPTDVKHVAHIGMDGPSANKPTWMNEYKPNSEASPMPSPKGKPATKKSSQGQLAIDVKDAQSPAGTPLDSPTRHHSSKSKQSRRHHSSGGSVGGSPSRSPSESSNKPRRHKDSGDLDSPNHDSPRRANSILGSESPSQGQPRIPKQSRQKKNKGSTGGRSSTSSKSKGLENLDQKLPYSDPGPGPD